MSTGPARRTLFAALVVSLAVNAFFIGAAATDLLVKPPSAASAPRALRLELRWIDQRLPEAAVDRIEAALSPMGPGVAADVERHRALRHELDALLAAPEPDRAAIDAQLDKIAVVWDAIERSVAKTTFDALLELPPDMREGLSASHP